MSKANPAPALHIPSPFDAISDAMDADPFFAQPAVWTPKGGQPVDIVVSYMHGALPDLTGQVSSAQPADVVTTAIQAVVQSRRDDTVDIAGHRFKIVEAKALGARMMWILQGPFPQP